MRVHKFIKQSEIEAPPDVVFAFHEKPYAFSELMPPWEKAEILQPADGIQPGSRAIIKTFVGPFSQIWEAEHVEYVQNRLFVDVQKRGPFAYWHHRHRFEPTSRGTTLMIDEIEYALPWGWLGDLLAGRVVRKKLARVFDYRHRILAEKFKRITS